MALLISSGFRTATREKLSLLVFLSKGVVLKVICQKGNMATKTSTSTKISISQYGDVYTVKEIETKTTTSPGKDPVIETTETVTEYKGKDNLPDKIRRQLEDKQVSGPINMTATRGDFANDVLNEVNKFRKLHGVQPLTLSPKLLKLCEERSRKMAEKDDMCEPDDGESGGCVTCMSSNDPEFYVKAEPVVSRWYSGSQGYDYTVEPEELTGGHFTQMIWKNSKEFGVAATKSKTNQIYIVSCFEPRGNYMNQFIENVCPPLSKSFLSNSAKAFLSIFDKKKDTEKKENVSSFNKEGLESHNKYRKRHGCPPLKYSAQLASYAQNWANEMARYDKFEHSNGKYGENLFYLYNSNPNVTAKASQACDSWYSEIKDYEFGKEPTSNKAGHFTQLVWKSTGEVGMGLAKSKSGKQYIVASYYPPGNYKGRYKENVPKPIQ